MKKHLFWLGAIAFVFAACSEDALTPDNKTEEPVAPEQPVVEPTYTTVNLASFDGSQSRVTVVPESRDPKEGSLTLFAEIANLSKEGKIEGFEKEGRYLSATCVYFDKNSGKYYVTYHMQGNNYLTTQNNETLGFIETFTLDQEGAPTVGKVYMAANPNELSFDFNHLYFDQLNNDYLTYNGADAGSTRIIAVGHKSEPSSKEGGKPNTAAIIGRLNLDVEPYSIDYETVYTGEKILDADGKSLGKVDAGDVNCVLRKSNYYYLATRKGIAVLNAKDDNLFIPIRNIGEDYQPVENSVYFVKTPGSAKHLSHIYTNSHFSLLYLEDHGNGEPAADSEAAAHIVNFSMDTGSGTLCGSNTSDSSTDGKGILDASKITDFTTWSSSVNQYVLPANVTPVDGKNVLAQDANGQLLAACLGKGGLYVFNSDAYKKEVVKFSDAEEGSRPVNGVFVETYENVNGSRIADGFIYVANGSCLTILDAGSLEKVAEYSAFGKDDKDASANYVNVVKMDNSTNGILPDRLITVAYGQAGVKVFKFVPPTKK